MSEKKRTHAPAGMSSVYQDKDGKWHGRVTMGVRDDGKPDRRHVRGKNRTEVTQKVRKLERERDSGRTRKPGRAWTVEQWLMHWIENVAGTPCVTRLWSDTVRMLPDTWCRDSGRTASTS